MSKAKACGAGFLALFIRLSGCNLRCVWCDTPYASWAPEGDMWSVSKILKLAENSKIQDVVITGGEPMLFDSVEELIFELKKFGKRITIETAGTIYREIDADLMSISPKLSNSAPPIETPGNWHNRHETTRLNFGVLSQLINRYSVQLKFVVSNLEIDLKEIEEILSQLPHIQPDRIMLMPEGRDSTQLWKSMRALVPIAMKKGWRICPRLQIDLFGDTKGT